MGIGLTNRIFTAVETPGGFGTFGDPVLVTVASDIHVWFEEERGESRDVGGGTKRWDAIAIGTFDESITENVILTLDDGTQWKVIDWTKLQGFLMGVSSGERRIELRLQRQR